MINDQQSLRHLRWGSYIHLDEHQMIPYRIRFELDADSLAQIDLLRNNNRQIQLQGVLLTNLRYYALLIFQAEDNSELIFTTNYLQEQESITIIKSAIAPSGKVSQEIRAASLQNQQLFNQLIKVHHWSMSQIITQLPLKSYRLSKWLSQIIALLITIIISPVIFYFIGGYFSGKLLIILTIFIILNLVFKYILIARIRQIFKDKVLFSFWVSSPNRRKIGLMLLSIFPSSIN
ncbi:MAG: hypothetical protein ACFCU5_07385 [Pleurocapsa sp.]